MLADASPDAAAAPAADVPVAVDGEPLLGAESASAFLGAELVAALPEDALSTDDGLAELADDEFDDVPVAVDAEPLLGAESAPAVLEPVLVAALPERALPVDGEFDELAEDAPDDVPVVSAADTP